MEPPNVKVEDQRPREGSGWLEVTQHIVTELDLQSRFSRNLPGKSPQLANSEQAT
jgi:hypothetical protein